MVIPSLTSNKEFSRQIYYSDVNDHLIKILSDDECQNAMQPDWHEHHPTTLEEICTGYPLYGHVLPVDVASLSTLVC